ncbi:MAG: glycosyltransferase family 4 protein [Candidatus Saccharimonadales bacterium]
MNIIWMSWKDRSHPLSGGAEAVSGAIMDRLARDGHSVKHLTASYPGAKDDEKVNGINIIRLGGRYSVYLKVKAYFKHNLAEWPDVIIDEMNTIPFAAALYSQKRTVLLTYQLARKVWFYQIVFPLSAIGYLIEPLYLRYIAPHYKMVLTESESTRQDMARYGFNTSRTHIFQVGMELKPLQSLPKKADRSLVLSLGAVRPMKRTLHAVKAFESARDEDTSLHMVIAGSTSSSYGQKVIQYVNNSRHVDFIEVKGRVSDNEKTDLMHQAGIILVTSVKEGWGLIVIEANSQGTPAAVYDTDGLRDSVQNGKTGLLVNDGNYVAMGSTIVNLLNDDALYNNLREAAWMWSKEFTLENSYQSFMEAIKLDDAA